MKGKYASPEELLTGQVVSRVINDEQVEDNDDTILEA
jgi:hypothetical protein